MLDITKNLAELTTDLVNIPSVSLAEMQIADEITRQLEAVADLKLLRFDNTLIASTQNSHPLRVILAGHLDTVPPNNNQTATLSGKAIKGLGAVDMKGGLAVMLKLAQEVKNFKKDVTFFFYEAEEIESKFNGLEKVSQNSPSSLAGDFAILLEPTDAILELGVKVQLDSK